MTYIIDMDTQTTLTVDVSTDEYGDITVTTDVVAASGYRHTHVYEDCSEARDALHDILRAVPLGDVAIVKFLYHVGYEMREIEEPDAPKRSPEESVTRIINKGRAHTIARNTRACVGDPCDDRDGIDLRHIAADIRAAYADYGTAESRIVDVTVSQDRDGSDMITVELSNGRVVTGRPDANFTECLTWYDHDGDFIHGDNFEPIIYDTPQYSDIISGIVAVLVDQAALPPVFRDVNGVTQDYEPAVHLMDDTLRDALSAEMVGATPQAFIEAYANAHRETFGEDFEPYDGYVW
ncbi:hypothetical protein [Bifidobacterium magnum]|uniref:AcrIC5-like domain-containing protein n=1 Tax=Bifidobacterium magnum TaxID=1692 RepID=A0A087B677_9BIFI|nr:hypothetical protein [Bifidobacterium magnum]KFI66527.1 hypothetical protein BMAGN_1435 [Bifidobacterium magnum]